LGRASFVQSAEKSRRSVRPQLVICLILGLYGVSCDFFDGGALQWAAKRAFLTAKRIAPGVSSEGFARLARPSKEAVAQPPEAAEFLAAPDCFGHIKRIARPDGKVGRGRSAGSAAYSREIGDGRNDGCRKKIQNDSEIEPAAVHREKPGDYRGRISKMAPTVYCSLTKLVAGGLTKPPGGLILPPYAIELFESGPAGPAFSLPGAGVQPIEQKITALIAPTVAAAGYDLVRVRLTGNQRPVLQIMAERPDRSMTAEDCARLSRALSPVLEEADPIPGAYSLEVSSPGIDRPLTRLKDFEDWRGYDAKIELDQPIEGRKRVRGALAGVEDGHVCLDIEGEADTAHIPYARIASAKLVLTEELIAESFRAAKRAASKETNCVEDNGENK
jgi:ribosome maturation factor RimP